ncbi:MAG: response regulator, partial [Elusimicrobia bacterium]|nr:response regulator [Elusimicrobiota bacterium]
MRLQSKVLAVFLPVAAVFAALVAFVGRGATESIMVRELGRRLRPQVEDFADKIAPDLEARRESAILTRLQAAQAFTGAEFAEALDPSGVVLAHTNVLETGKLRTDAGAREALDSDRSVSVRERGPHGPVLVVSAPVWRPDEEFLLSGGPHRRLGTLRVALPLGATLDSARRVGAIVAAMAAGFCLVALALSLGLLRLVLLPVRSIAEATARVASGNYNARVPVDSGDELGELADSFNRMGETLSRTVVSRDSLEEALAIARAALDASADGVLVVGRGPRVVTHNQRFLEMWGIPDDLGATRDSRRLIAFVQPQVEDDGTFLAGVVREDADFEASERRDLLKLKDGRVFERISRPYRIAGEAVGRTLTFRDLTLHFEGVRALSQARDEAVETARAKAQFLANVSHELRTPLNAVIGSAELLRRERVEGETREHVETLARAAKALLELVDDVLDFSKLEAGRMTVERARLRPADLIADALSLVAPRAAGKGLKLRVDPGEAGYLELLGDPMRLRQILLNLLANAVKFTEKGEVAVAARPLSENPSSVELEFSVRDTGVGIPAEQAARLFSPFTQGDGSTTRRYGGTGLGLAISRSLLSLMGGEIGFDSEPGKGSRFWFRVRLDRAGAPAPSVEPAAAALESRPRDRLRVLAVEDNAINRRLLARQLERLGCPVVSVSDGREALARYRDEDFGLVLLDCQMPGLDGYATAAEIRRLEAGRRRVPIVAITANATEDDRRRCLDSGMDDFLSKPVTLERLAAALDRWDLPFDERALAAFAAVAADGPQALKALLAQFLSDADKRLEDARRALDAGDADACSRAAHALKGAAAAVGARGLRELCRSLEAAAQ